MWPLKNRTFLKQTRPNKSFVIGKLPNIRFVWKQGGVSWTKIIVWRWLPLRYQVCHLFVYPQQNNTFRVCGAFLFCWVVLNKKQHRKIEYRDFVSKQQFVRLGTDISTSLNDRSLRSFGRDAPHVLSSILKNNELFQNLMNYVRKPNELFSKT